MTDEQFERFVRKTAAGYNRPPDTPREEMWRRIEAAVREQYDAGLGEPDTAGRHRVSPWVWGSAGLAAALVVGVAIGRFVPNREEPTALFRAATAESRATAYQLAATEHLTRVETFLTVFRLEARAGRADGQTIAPARDLLSTTQLLIDSPAAADVRLRGLLEDVELVLAQIAQYSNRRPVNELDLIDRGIEQRGVLLKLQSTLAGGTQGAL